MLQFAPRSLHGEMKMIKSIKLTNFRSIQKQQEINLAPITLLYGPNGAGKSSLLYAAQVLKNIAIQPNQGLDAFFNLPGINLGGFEQVSFNHGKGAIVLGLTLHDADNELSYDVSVDPNKGVFNLQSQGKVNFKASLEVTFPYPANRNVESKLSVGAREYTAKWNGLTTSLTAIETPTPEDIEEANRVNSLLNLPIETLRTVDFIPIRRGFFKPNYPQYPLTPNPVSEDEVATLLGQSRYLSSKLSQYLQEITNREFALYTPPGRQFSTWKQLTRMRE